MVKASAEHMRRVVFGEEIPWEGVERFLKDLDGNLNGVETVEYEVAGPGEAHHGRQEEVLIEEDAQSWDTGVQDEDDWPLGSGEGRYGPLDQTVYVTVQTEEKRSWRRRG